MSTALMPSKSGSRSNWANISTEKIFAMIIIVLRIILRGNG